MSAVAFAIPSLSGLPAHLDRFLPALGVGLLTGLAPFGLVLFKRNQRFGKFEEGLPEALDLMVSALRAGHSLIAAMGLVGSECPDPVGGEFRICFEEQNYGLELKTAHGKSDRPRSAAGPENCGYRDHDPEGERRQPGRGAGQDLLRDPGAVPLEAADQGAHGARTADRDGFSAFCLWCLGIALFFVNPDMMSILWTRQIGIKLLWAAVGMTLLGGLIIRKIVNMEV